MFRRDLKSRDCQLGPGFQIRPNEAVSCPFCGYASAPTDSAGLCYNRVMRTSWAIRLAIAFLLLAACSLPSVDCHGECHDDGQCPGQCGHVCTHAVVHSAYLTAFQLDHLARVVERAFCIPCSAPADIFQPPKPSA